MPETQPKNPKPDLADDEHFVDSRELIMRVIGVFLLRSGGTLTVTQAELDEISNLTIAFDADTDDAGMLAVKFYFTNRRTN